jgi:nucleotide-binding universal stress UspA family protein
MDPETIPRGCVAVGVDGSPSSRQALLRAADVAAAEHRPLVLVHAVDATAPDRVLDEAHAEAVSRFPMLEVHTLLLVGDPRDVLHEVSARASLLVVGSRGRGPVRSVLLGSTGLALTRHAACPVLVVRPYHPGTVRHGVLVGIDGTEDSVPALAFGFAESSRQGLPLTVLHVVPRLPRSVAEPTVLEVTGDELERHRLWVAEAMAGLREQHPDVPVSTEVVPGLAREELLRRAERMDLVVVSAHRGGLASELVLGSVAASVVENARTQVAVVPVATRT